MNCAFFFHFMCIFALAIFFLLPPSCFHLGGILSKINHPCNSGEMNRSECQIPMIQILLKISFQRKLKVAKYNSRKSIGIHTQIGKQQFISLLHVIIRNCTCPFSSTIFHKYSSIDFPVKAQRSAFYFYLHQFQGPLSKLRKAKPIIFM